MKRHGVAMKLDQEFRNTGLLFEREIGNTVDSRHHVLNFGALRLQDLKIRTEYLHDDRGGCSGQCLFDALGDELHDVEREPNNALQMPAHVVNDFIAHARAVLQTDIELRDVWSKGVFTQFGPAGSLCRLQGLWNLCEPLLLGLIERYLEPSII